jgi:hypothetical protein
MGGPGVRDLRSLNPPAGALRGRAPLRGVVEARRAGTRGETGDRRSLPLLSTPHIFLLAASVPRHPSISVSGYRLVSPSRPGKVSVALHLISKLKNAGINRIHLYFLLFFL